MKDALWDFMWFIAWMLVIGGHCINIYLAFSIIYPENILVLIVVMAAMIAMLERLHALVFHFWRRGI